MSRIEQSKVYPGLVAMALAASAGYAGEFLNLQVGKVRLDTHKSLNMTALISTTTFVVQYADKITLSHRETLESMGAEIYSYLPDDALVIHANAELADLIAQSAPGVRAVVPYQANWKISTSLAKKRRAGTYANRPEILQVQTFRNRLDESVQSLKAVQGVTIRYSDDRVILVEAPRHQLHAIAAIDGIEWVQEMPVMQTLVLPMDSDVNPGMEKNDTVDAYADLTGYESGTKIMKFEVAYQRGFYGAGQIAGIADTGLDTGDLSTIHPDFKPGVISGYPAGLLSFDWSDPQGHGTHVGGSIVGNGAKSSGKIRGGAVESSLIVGGMWSKLINNLLVNPDLKKVIGPAYMGGARVQSNSWGANKNEYDANAASVDEIMWNNPDLLILFAAGNSGVDANKDGRVDEGSLGTPGTAKNVLTVGASENLEAKGGIQKSHGELRDGDKNWGVEPIRSDKLSNNADGMAVFSSRGPTSDGRLKPEIVAPGTNILSIHSQAEGATPLWGLFNQDYAWAGGTSMATPLTAGAATVVREYLIKAKGVYNPSGALVKAALIHTAKDMYPGQYGTGPKQELQRRPNVHEGYGRVNMDSATSLGEESMIIDELAGVGAGEEKSYNVTVGDGEGVRATLVYTDAPGAAAAGKALVNDLDLELVAPNGFKTSLRDHVNNNEMLELDDVAPGQYRLVVKGTNVPNGKNGKQGFAVIYSRVKR